MGRNTSKGVNAHTAMVNTTSKVPLQILTTYLHACGVRDVIHSPGSRNAPMLIAAAAQEDWTLHSVIDERSAGFQGVGMSLMQGRPVVVCCTSGSALANYYPAVAEAFYQKVPLIVLSADRPEWAVDNGQGQTIRQNGLLDLHVAGSLKIDGDLYAAKDLKKIEKDLTSLLRMSLLTSEPIHINVHLEEPLYDTVRFRNIAHELPEVKKNALTLSDHLIVSWEKAERKLVIIGQDKGSDDLATQALLKYVAHRPDILVCTETTSNIWSPMGIPHIDAFLENNTVFWEEEPNILLHWSGAVISKRIKHGARKWKSTQRWSLSATQWHPEIFGKVDIQITGSLAAFFSELQRRTVSAQVPNSYVSRWEESSQRKQRKAAHWLEDLPLESDISVLYKMLKALPKGACIHSGNSSVIRYFQLIPLSKTHRWFCNRGTSGIEGSLSTALGAALADPERIHIAVIGDVSFFYDCNALLRNSLPPNLKILILHNGGGDIFRIIPGARENNLREAFLSTAHQHSAEGICKSYKIDYLKCSNFTNFDHQISSWLANTSACLLEVWIPKQTGPTALQQFFEEVGHIS